MGLESGVGGRLKNLMMSKFGFHRLPKSESQQPLLSHQDSYYENDKYEYQSIEDEGNTSSKKAISSLEKKVGFLDEKIYRINYGLHKLENDFHSTSVIETVNSSIKKTRKEVDELKESVAQIYTRNTIRPVDMVILKLQEKNATLEKKLENMTTYIELLNSNKKDIQKLQEKNAYLENKLEDMTASIQLLSSTISEQQVAILSSSAMEGVYDDHLDVKNDLLACKVMLMFLICVLIGYLLPI